MTKTLTHRAKQAKQKPEAVMTRRYEPEEFDADTAEERPVALLAEKRRQFLAGLSVRQNEAFPPVDE